LSGVEPQRPAPHAPSQAQQDPAASVSKRRGRTGTPFAMHSRRLTRQRRELEGTLFKAPGVAATGLAASIVRWLSFISGLRPFAVFGVLTLGVLKKKLDGIV
jgi:hypothetical protein